MARRPHAALHHRAGGNRAPCGHAARPMRPTGRRVATWEEVDGMSAGAVAEGRLRSGPADAAPRSAIRPSWPTRTGTRWRSRLGRMCLANTNLGGKLASLSKFHLQEKGLQRRIETSKFLEPLSWVESLWCKECHSMPGVSQAEHDCAEWAPTSDVGVGPGLASRHRLQRLKSVAQSKREKVGSSAAA